MKILLRVLCMTCFGVVLGAPSAPAQGVGTGRPDMVLTGGRIFTADSSNPWVEALAITGSRITATGTSATILALAGPNTRRIDLGGRTVTPGFNDAHDHLGCHVIRPSARVNAASTGLPDPPFAPVADSLRALVARAPEGTWLTASVGAAVLEDPAARRDSLDAIAPRHPVLLTVWTGHDAILNSAALREVGLSDTVVSENGSRYQRQPDSTRLNGVLEEYAVWLVYRLLCNAQPDTALVRALRNRGERMVRLGITSTQTMAHHLEPTRLMEVVQAAALPLRVRIVPMPLERPQNPEYEWGVSLASAVSAPDATGGVIVSGLKWILDGSPVERRAAQRTPYYDRAGELGRINFSADELRAMLQRARQLRQQPLLHAVGDSSIAVVLNLLQATGGEAVWQPARVRIEHGDGLVPDLLVRARRLGVVVVQNPAHLALPGILEKRYDASFLAGYQPLQSLVAAGIPLAIGGDGTLDPFQNIMLATTHPNRPAEALTREQAVAAYTRGGAYAEFAEQEKGTLGIGMLADVAVLSRDIFAIPAEQLPGTTSVLTIIGGQIVYDELSAGGVHNAPARN